MGKERKGSVPMKSENAKKNMAKYDSYRLAFGKINAALKLGFPIEAIALEESIISDRLESAAAGKGISLKKRQAGRTADFSKLAELVRKEAGFRTFAEKLKEHGLSAEYLVAWGLQRNDFVHNVAHGAPRGVPAVSASTFETQGAIIAANGLRLARLVCDWSKKELAGKPLETKRPRTSCKLHVTAPRGIDLAHCAFRAEFKAPGLRNQLDPVELVNEFGGVYDSHGIAIPRKGGVLHIATGGDEVAIRLDDPRIGIAFYENRNRTDSNMRTLYARAVWEDREWEMSELFDSRLETNGAFDVRKLALGIRFVPDMKGGTEQLVSYILYGGFVIHAPYGQKLGRGANCKFWVLEKGKWTQLRNPRPRKEPDEDTARSFFG